MRGNGYYRNLALFRPKIPEDAIGSRGFILHVSLKHFLLLRPFQGAILMRVQTWMADIGFHVPQSLFDLLMLARITGLQSVVRFFCLIRQHDLERHYSSISRSANSAKEPRSWTRPAAASARPLRTDANACGLL